MHFRYKIGQVLMFAVVALSATFFILWFAALSWLSSVDGENRRQTLMHSAQTIMAGADALVDRYSAVGRTLVSSLPPDGSDFTAFGNQARAIARSLSDGWIIISDTKGQQLFNSATIKAGALPVRNTVAMEAHKTACRTGKEVVSDIGIAAITKVAAVSVNFPFYRGGECFVLSVGFPANIFHNFMADLPEGWLAGIADARGNYITRSLQNDELIGTPASDGWRRVMGKDGISEFQSREGIELVNANVRSAKTGWATAVAVSKSALYRPFIGSLAVAGVCGGLAFALCLAAVSIVGRRAARALSVAKDAAQNLETSAPSLQRTGERDIDAILDALQATSAKLQAHEKTRAAYQRQMELASKEINHRSKNLLAVVAAMARFIARSSDDLPDFHQRFNDRLEALSRCQDLLVHNEWLETPLKAIAAAQVDPVAEGRIFISGPDVFVMAETVQPFSMIFHELATNAVKYGALSRPEGRVDLSWSWENGPNEGKLLLRWEESGGAPVVAPATFGFGNTVITESCRTLGGTAEFAWRAEGLICSFSADMTGRMSLSDRSEAGV